MAGGGRDRMRQVIVTRFGGPEVLEVIDRPNPAPGEMLAAGEVPGAGKVRVRLTSVGMNHAEPGGGSTSWRRAILPLRRGWRAGV